VALMGDSLDWKAFFDPKLVFLYPIRTLAFVCAVAGIIKSPLDANNRYLALGLFLLSVSFAGQVSGNIFRPSNIQYMGTKLRWEFSGAALLQALFVWPLTLILGLFCLHQFGLTPRLDAFLATWTRTHPLL
jgi:hypothetical protein